jgi:hypothetical protein
MSVCWRRALALRGGRLTPTVLALIITALFGALTLRGAWSRDSEGGANPVAATVDGVEIYVAEVDQHVQRALQDRTLDDETRSRLQAETLEQLIRQQVVLGTLEKRGEACNQQQLELALSRLQDELKRQDKSLDEFCQSQRTCLPALKRALRWQLSWTSYLEKSVTAQRLQEYFADHRREFDGTRLRVAQILLQWPDDPQARDGVVQRAASLRADITAGKLSFAEAAQKYSQSPSARAGGALAWISRHEPMPEFFGQAAFRLEAGEISPPIASPLGVHLIQCIEIEPGKKTWEDVRDDVRKSLTEELFESLAKNPQSPPDVKYTGRAPHFAPGTRLLVMPVEDDDAAAKRTEK